MDKVLKKRIAGNCIICHENDMHVLDVHRILPGQEGGLYKNSNVVVLCANCHRKIHKSDQIKIHGWFQSTGGRLLHCTVDGEECYLREKNII